MNHKPRYARRTDSGMRTRGGRNDPRVVSVRGWRSGILCANFGPWNYHLRTERQRSRHLSGGLNLGF